MQHSFDLPQTAHQVRIARYLHLTRIVMPALAQGTKRHWPVQSDHCFQRIVLDTVCGGVWYDHVARPAYRHLSETQVMQAVQICDDIIADKADLNALNWRSLRWRGKV